MAYDENNDLKTENIYSKRIRAGKRRTYFFDVRATKGNDYYLTITESRKRFNDDGYDRHKVFLYKEDFNKFVKALSEAVDFVKTDLMPDFDFDAFNHDEYEMNSNGNGYVHNDTKAEVKAEATEEIAEQEVTAQVVETINAVEVVSTETVVPETEIPKTDDLSSLDNGASEEAEKW